VIAVVRRHGSQLVLRWQPIEGVVTTDPLRPVYVDNDSDFYDRLELSVDTFVDVDFEAGTIEPIEETAE
jgi:hypothetical protein